MNSSKPLTGSIQLMAGRSSLVMWSSLAISFSQTPLITWQFESHFGFFCAYLYICSLSLGRSIIFFYFFLQRSLCPPWAALHTTVSYRMQITSTVCFYEMYGISLIYIIIFWNLASESYRVQQLQTKK